MIQDEATQRDPIDETSDESFPASDPPAWTGAHAGLPCGRASDARWTRVAVLREAAKPVMLRVERLAWSVREAGSAMLARARRMSRTGAEPHRR
ncbi:MAG TPA: hypothetical protein VGG39_12255 [Polyangiaceae bacterium]|jgi:hypothetical protein